MVYRYYVSLGFVVICVLFVAFVLTSADLAVVVHVEDNEVLL